MLTENEAAAAIVELVMGQLGVRLCLPQYLPERRAPLRRVRFAGRCAANRTRYSVLPVACVTIAPGHHCESEGVAAPRETKTITRLKAA